MSIIRPDILNPPPLTDKQKADVLAAMKLLWRKPALALEHGFPVPRADWEVACEMANVEYEKFLICVHPEYANKGQDGEFAEKCRSYTSPTRSRRMEMANGIANAAMHSGKDAVGVAKMFARPSLKVEHEHKIKPPGQPEPPRVAEVAGFIGDSGSVMDALEGPIGT